MPARWLRHAVLLEPGEHPRPGVLGRVGAVARPIIGIKSVRRVGIDLELAGLAGRLARRGHAIDAFNRDALIGATEATRSSVSVATSTCWVRAVELTKSKALPFKRCRRRR